MTWDATGDRPENHKSQHADEANTIKLATCGPQRRRHNRHANREREANNSVTQIRRTPVHIRTGGAVRPSRRPKLAPYTARPGAAPHLLPGDRRVGASNRPPSARRPLQGSRGGVVSQG
jgi:hypothetical protein